MTTFTLGLCAGRHDLPVSDFIFADGGYYISYQSDYTS